MVARRKIFFVSLMLLVLSGCFDSAKSLIAWAPVAFTRQQTISPRIFWTLVAKDPYFGDNDEENDDDDLDWYDGRAELVTEDDGDDADWVPDRERARQRQRRTVQPQPARAAAQAENAAKGQNGGSMYTDEEEELISAMGGKTKNSPVSKREAGFLGDSTLQEIAMDYSVPVCYLADVLTLWGVPVPISIHDRLGDLVTGEQAFAIVEAIYTLDVSALHDRYSNQSLVSVCEDYDIPLRDAFEMAVKEGWSLPFGVQTCLRVEQEDELIRVLGSI